MVRHEGENARVAVRNLRRDAIHAAQGPAEEAGDSGGRGAPRAGRHAEADRPPHRRDRQAVAAEGSRPDARVGRGPHAHPAPMHESTTQTIPQTGAVPRHVAIIMDGNGRWAKQRLPAARRRPPRGVEAVRATVARLRRARRRVPDAVRVQLRELAPPGRRGLVPDAAVPRRARAGGEQAARERHPLQRDRRPRAVRAKRSSTLIARGRGADRRATAG